MEPSNSRLTNHKIKVVVVIMHPSSFAALHCILFCFSVFTLSVVYVEFLVYTMVLVSILPNHHLCSWQKVVHISVETGLLYWYSLISYGDQH